MKWCELCKRTARIHCESDQASLCWSCDARVHSANFLVARHSRNLLCRACQCPTPWFASGAELGPTASACVKCADRREDGGDYPPEVVEEIPVVPWSPPAESSSSAEEEAEADGDAVVFGKRRRLYGSSGNSGSNEGESWSSSSARATVRPNAGTSRIGARGSAQIGVKDGHLTRAGGRNLPGPSARRYE
ncbi:B-box type zinc finger family protein [Striga hermonthica]|uniref:B-box type zinc finger family protein n=1 Tax=Striga hermonthica TaxID=68872 RepID=A0A9N7RDX0_STRHE|nr:B-box type zinc finger family protein [Striga hermonthica]